MVLNKAGLSKDNFEEKNLEMRAEEAEDLWGVVEEEEDFGEDFDDADLLEISYMP